MLESRQFAVEEIARIFRCPLHLLQVSKQFTPNGGSSLRDAVNRLEKDAQETRADVKDLRNRADESNERIINSVGKVHARLDEHVRDHLTKGQ